MKKTVFVFPGQGAQHVGMGSEWAKDFQGAQHIFEEANDILGFDLAKLCFEGPEDKLTSTQFSQPAILTTSVAVLRIVQQEMPLQPVAVAGLSLGEYTALVAAGSLSFKEALGLVKVRGELMQQAGQSKPGTMTSVIGLDQERVEAICAAVQHDTGACCQVANLNCPGQIVISGDVEALKQAGVLCQEAGAKRVLPLSVSGAFHSELMRPASEQFHLAVQEVSLQEPQCAFYNNVTAQAQKNPEDIKKDLVEQLCHSVLWEQSIRNIAKDLEPDVYLEMGPGKVLAGLLKRIDKSLNCYSIGVPADLQVMEGVS